MSSPLTWPVKRVRGCSARDVDELVVLQPHLETRAQRVLAEGHRQRVEKLPVVRVLVLRPEISRPEVVVVAEVDQREAAGRAHEIR